VVFGPGGAGGGSGAILIGQVVYLVERMSLADWLVVVDVRVEAVVS
jgi:hypothetical protein